MSPSGGDAHHVVGDVVAWETDRFDTARVLDILGETEQRHVVISDAAVVALMHDHLHHVDDPLGPFFRRPIVLSQHHAEV